MSHSLPSVGLSSLRMTTLNGHGSGTWPATGARGGPAVLTTKTARVPSGDRAQWARDLVSSGSGSSGNFFPSGVSTQYAPSRPTSSVPGPVGLAAGGGG